MTLRLIGLMSIVLLLCLGAFGLIAVHYHQQVMDEAAKIASESAKAIFGKLEGDENGNFFRVDRTAGIAWSSQITSGDPRAESPSARTELLILGDVDPVETRKLIQEVTQRRQGRDVPSSLEATVQGVPIGYQMTTIGRAVPVECRDAAADDERCVRFNQVLSTTGAHQLFVSIEDIHARADGGGLLLTIPTFTTEQHGATGSGETEGDVELVSLDASGDRFDAKATDIQLPISVQQYESLFDRTRQQTMLLFLGVFVVGIALSAGAAARFTRPARRLDAALRELSDGDLDAEVEVRGNDEIARLGLAFNDMARKMRANRERAREMVRRDKLSALGRLAAGVAHDVRNPLHSIGLTLTHLTDTGRPEDPQRVLEFDRSVALIRGEIRRLDQLVVNFLRFANGENRERCRVDLKALVQETARLIRKEAEWRSIEMKLELDDVPEVEVDVEAIRSSLLNLVLNSCEAMPQGGTLEILLTADGHEVRLEVADSGRGIPADQQEKVFDFGYSTREGGSGLGLVMVHQCIVEDHHGRVSLESDEGSGTRVRLVLPLAASPPQPTDPETEEADGEWNR